MVNLFTHLPFFLIFYLLLYIIAVDEYLQRQATNYSAAFLGGEATEEEEVATTSDPTADAWNAATIAISVVGVVFSVCVCFLASRLFQQNSF